MILILLPFKSHGLFCHECNEKLWFPEVDNNGELQEPFDLSKTGKKGQFNLKFFLCFLGDLKARKIDSEIK